MSYFVINAIAYLLISLLSFFIFRKNLSFSWIWLWWGLSALTTIYFINGNDFVLYNITIDPFVFLLVNLLLATWPLAILRRDDLNFKYLKGSDLKLNILDKLPLILFILLVFPTVENFFLAASLQGNDLDALYNRAETNLDTYHRLSWYSRNANRIVDYIFYVVPFLLFREFAKPKLCKSNVFYLSVVMLDVILTAYCLAARTEFVKIAFSIITYYVFFKSTIPSRRLRKLRYTSLIISIFFIIVLGVITVSRYSGMGKEGDIWVWVSLYSGEGFYRFADLMWHKKDAIMLGDDNFPLFKQILGLDTFTDGWKRREFWEPKIGVPNNIFYTYIGNFVSDFGFVITTLINMCFGFFLFKLVMNMKRRLYYWQVVFFSIFHVSLLFGIMHFVYKVYVDQFRLLGVCLFAAFLYLTETSFFSRVKNY